MNSYTIDPGGSNIVIDVQELKANVASCRVYLFDASHAVTELTPSAGAPVPWQMRLPNPPATYKNSMIVCTAVVTDPSATPGAVYEIVLGASQPPGQRTSDTTTPSPAPFGATPTALATLSINLL